MGGWGRDGWVGGRKGGRVSLRMVGYVGGRTGGRAVWFVLDGGRQRRNEIVDSIARISGAHAAVNLRRSEVCAWTIIGPSWTTARFRADPAPTRTNKVLVMHARLVAECAASQRGPHLPRSCRSQAFLASRAHCPRTIIARVCGHPLEDDDGAKGHGGGNLTCESCC